MSFEQTAYSFASGQPPTPIRTPTSESFEEQDGLQTPNLGPSYYDSKGALDPAASFSGESYQRTPKAQTRDLSGPAAHLLTTPNFALLSPQMPAAAVINTETRTAATQSVIQTPPPTNFTSTKRREKQQHIGMASSGMESRRHPTVSHPGNDDGLMITSAISPTAPYSFDVNSSAVFGGSLGAATAPAYPQQRILWDGNLNEMDLAFPTDNLFMAPKADGLQPFISNHDASMQQTTFIGDTENLAAGGFNNGAAGDLLNTQMQDLSGSVDPSLLFSSGDHRIVDGIPDQDALQPYAYQVQEARREKAYAGISKTQRRRRKPSVDSPAVVAALESLRDGSRPGLRRSMTDSFVGRSGRSSSSSSRAGTSHGRSSPLKQIRADAKSRKRTSVGLVIGADGRARMETVVHHPTPGSLDGTEVDSTAYSSESDSSGTNDDEPDSFAGVATSFGADTSFGNPSKTGRVNSSPSHSQKSSYSSFYGNSSENVRSKGKNSSKRTSRHLILDPVKEGGSFEDDPMIGQEADSAQEALMHSLKASQRGRYSPQKQSSGLEPFVSSPNTMTEAVFPAPGSAGTTRRSSYRR